MFKTPDGKKKSKFWPIALEPKKKMNFENKRILTKN